MVANSGLDKNFPVARIDKQTTQRKFCKIIRVSRVLFAPEFFGNHAKQGAPVAMKISGRNGNEFHTIKNDNLKTVIEFLTPEFFRNV